MPLGTQPVRVARWAPGGFAVALLFAACTNNFDLFSVANDAGDDASVPGDGGGNVVRNEASGSGSGGSTSSSGSGSGSTSSGGNGSSGASSGSGGGSSGAGSSGASSSGSSSGGGSSGGGSSSSGGDACIADPQCCQHAGDQCGSCTDSCGNQYQCGPCPVSTMCSPADAGVCVDFCSDHACYDCCAECAQLQGRDCVALHHNDPHTSCSNSGCGKTMCMMSAHCDCCY